MTLNGREIRVGDIYRRPDGELFYVVQADDKRVAAKRLSEIPANEDIVMHLLVAFTVERLMGKSAGHSLGTAFAAPGTELVASDPGSLEVVRTIMVAQRVEGRR